MYSIILAVLILIQGIFCSIFSFKKKIGVGMIYGPAMIVLGVLILWLR